MDYFLTQTMQQKKFIDMRVDWVTTDLGIGLKTSTIVTIPPHNIAIILLEPPFRVLQCKGVNTELF